MRENMDQKKLRIWTLFMQWLWLLLLLIVIAINDQYIEYLEYYAEGYFVNINISCYIMQGATSNI